MSRATANTKDMTTGSPTRLLFMFSMLSSIVQVIMRVSCALFLMRVIGSVGVF